MLAARVILANQKNIYMLKLPKSIGDSAKLL